MKRSSVAGEAQGHSLNGPLWHHRKAKSGTIRIDYEGIARIHGSEESCWHTPSDEKGTVFGDYLRRILAEGARFTGDLAVTIDGFTDEVRNPAAHGEPVARAAVLLGQDRILGVECRDVMPGLSQVRGQSQLWEPDSHGSARPKSPARVQFSPLTVARPSSSCVAASPRVLYRPGNKARILATSTRPAISGCAVGDVSVPVMTRTRLVGLGPQECDHRLARHRPRAQQQPGQQQQLLVSHAGRKRITSGVSWHTKELQLRRALHLSRRL